MGVRGSRRMRREDGREPAFMQDLLCVLKYKARGFFNVVCRGPGVGQRRRRRMREDEERGDG